MVEKGKMRNQIKSNSFQSLPLAGKKPLNKPGSKTPSRKKNDTRPGQIGGLALVLWAIYLLLAFASYLSTWTQDQDIVQSLNGSRILSPSSFPVHNWMGLWGALVAHLFIFKGFGLASFVFVFVFFLLGFRLLFRESLLHMGKSMAYSFFFLVYISVGLGFLEQFFTKSPEFLSGIFGFQINAWLRASIGVPGTLVVLLFAGLTCLLFIFNWEFKWPFKSIASESDFGQDPYKTPASSLLEKEDLQNYALEKNPKNRPLIIHNLESEPEATILYPNTSPEELDVKEVPELLVRTKPPIVEKTTEKKIIEPEFRIEKSENDVLSEDLVAKFGKFDEKLELSDYIFPKLELLENYGNPKVQVNTQELEANKNKIVETLGHYDIEIDKIAATIGPTVTLYEIIPKAGVRISKIKNLEDDIALSLAALGIRIIAPIPGKGTIGIEVPNGKPELVSMRSVLSTEKYQKTEMELPIALGKTISNEVFIADLTKMPHLLMAGATGQGKSVGINALLVSLLFKKHPSQLKFVLVDPKKVELTLFRKIERHFLAKLPGEEEAIITDTKKVVHTLNSLCIEMDQRYDLLKDGGVRNLKEYNYKFVNRRLNPELGHRFLPFIVLVIDEFADLMMTAGKEIETPIARLAQLARAVGIHLVIATQRPSVNIITGTIKANFPARIAFRVTSKIDSRTILDSGGADQLIGRGDMLLSTGSEIIRLQCAFVDTPEVERITDFIGSQRGYTSAMLLPEFIDENDPSSNNIDLEDRDQFFDEAARLIVRHQQGSTSLIQRKLKLGYNRAGRIIDELEAAKIVGPFEGSKARQVLFQDENQLNEYLESLSFQRDQ